MSYFKYTYLKIFAKKYLFPGGRLSVNLGTECMGTMIIVIV